MKKILPILALLMTLPGLLPAQTQISGSQSGTLGPGIYLVVGNITVNAGQTLTVAPGTTFLHNGYWWWKIYGSLHAVGTATDSIKWLRQNPIPGHRWAGIRFQPGATNGSIFSYCVLEYGYKSETDYPNQGGCIYTNTVPITVTHSRISYGDAYGGGGGIYAFQANGMVITYNLICDNWTSGGIFLHGSSNANISYNVVARNISTGT